MKANSEKRAENRAALRLRVPERRQLAMVVQCPDDLVPAQHPVRMVMALVETLDVARFSEPIKARAGVAGRDATDPRLLVGLWLYACIRGIGSARELARRSEESAAFRWLCGGVTVNHRLLSDFRVDHGAALDELFTQVIASLVDKQLVSVSRVSQDGVRVRVSAGADSFRREERLQKLLAQAKQHVEELRRQMENPESSAVLSAKQEAARRRAAEEKQQRLEQAIAQLPELKQKQAEAAQKAGQWEAGAKDPRQGVAGEHQRCGSTADEDAEWRLQSGMQRAVGDRHQESRHRGRRGQPRRIGLVGAESTDARAGGTAQRRQAVEQHLLDGGDDVARSFGASTAEETFNRSLAHTASNPKTTSGIPRLV